MSDYYLEGKEPDFFSKEVERKVLAVLIRFPDLFADADTMIDENHFHLRIHKLIYSSVKNCYIKDGVVSQEIIAQKLRDRGVNDFEGVPIFEYCDELFYLGNLSHSVGMTIIRHLRDAKIKQSIVIAAKEVINLFKKDQNQDINSLIDTADNIYYQAINQQSPAIEINDLYQNIEQLVRQRGESPADEVGLLTNFPIFNHKFGGIRSRNGVYAVVSRPAQGKSTWLLNMAEGITLRNPNTIALYLDTEMTTDVSRFRLASSLTSVPMWYLETGNWKKKTNYIDLVDKNIKLANDRIGKIFHLKVTNKPIEEICSIVRRWIYKIRHNNENPPNVLLIYDYIKLTGEKITGHWSEHQAIGSKIDALNDMGEKLNIPIWVAMQANRSAESGNEDSSAVALSDRLQWFASSLFMFKRKSPEEIAEHGPNFGTHKLVALKYRFEGRESFGHNDYVNTAHEGEKRKLAVNYINFEVNNFKVEEKGTLQDVIKALNDDVDLMENNKLPEESVDL